MNNNKIKNKKWIIVESIQLNEYDKEITEMYTETYSYMGPLRQTFEGIIEKYPCSCYILRDTNTKNIYSVIFYQLTKFGNKITMCISKNDNENKNTIDMLEKMKELLNTDGFFIELSGKLESVLKKNLKNITDTTIILKILNGLGKKKNNSETFTEEDIFFETKDGKEDDRRKQYGLLIKGELRIAPVGSYLRIVNKVEKERKALYGKPCLSGNFKLQSDTNKCERTCIKKTTENTTENTTF